MIPGAAEFPSFQEVERVVREHPLIKFKEEIKRIFVVGSFAKGTQKESSDVDILLEIPPVADRTAAEVAEHYRTGLRDYFVRNNIRGTADEVHPQLMGRRADLYITYDAGQDTLPKVEIPRGSGLVTFKPGHLTELVFINGRSAAALVHVPSGFTATDYAVLQAEFIRRSKAPAGSHVRCETLHADEVTPQGIYYVWGLVNCNGGHFELLGLPGDSDARLSLAGKHLRSDRDVVKLSRHTFDRLVDLQDVVDHPSTYARATVIE